MTCNEFSGKFSHEFTRDFPGQLNSITIYRQALEGLDSSFSSPKGCLFDKDVPSPVCFTLEIKRICCEAATHAT